MPKNAAGSEVMRLIACSSESARRLAHEGADQISRIAGVAEHIDVRAAVRNADHGARIAEFTGDALLVDIEQRHHEDQIEIILDGEIEK